MRNRLVRAGWFTVRDAVTPAHFRKWLKPFIL
jgi:hypothetical protein